MIRYPSWPSTGRDMVNPRGYHQVKHNIIIRFHAIQSFLCVIVHYILKGSLNFITHVYAIYLTTFYLFTGFIYNDVWDFVPNIITIKNYFKWDKISMLGHSLGSVAGLQYAGLYPDDVDLCIAVENIVFQEYDLDTVLKTLPKLIKKKEMCQHLLNTKLTHGTMEELTDKWYAGMLKSIKRENFHYLMKRGVKPSPEDPTKFCFTKDIRLKYETVKPSKSEFLEKIVERISCPLLYFKATGSSYKLSDPHCCRVQDILKKNNPYYESHNVHGTHHVHVNNPEVLQPIIVDFLRKHKFIDE